MQNGRWSVKSRQAADGSTVRSFVYYDKYCESSHPVPFLTPLTREARCGPHLNAAAGIRECDACRIVAAVQLMDRNASKTAERIFAETRKRRARAPACVPARLSVLWKGRLHAGQGLDFMFDPILHSGHLGSDSLDPMEAAVEAQGEGRGSLARGIPAACQSVESHRFHYHGGIRPPLLGNRRDFTERRQLAPGYKHDSDFRSDGPELVLGVAGFGLGTASSRDPGGTEFFPWEQIQSFQWEGETAMLKLKISHYGYTRTLISPEQKEVVDKILEQHVSRSPVAAH